MSVPIWFIFTRTAVGHATPDAACKPRRVGREEVVPEHLDAWPRSRVIAAQPSQSSSAKPSSIETIGYWSTSVDQLFDETFERRARRLLRQPVTAVVVEMRRSDIDRKRDLVTERSTRRARPQSADPARLGIGELGPNPPSAALRS